jgi:hypothetical protein
LALGIPVDELGDQISFAELVQWTAFERFYGPILIQERVDVAGAIAAWAAAAAGGSKAPPEDFLPKWGEGTRQSAEDMVAVMRGIMGDSSDGDSTGHPDQGS